MPWLLLQQQIRDNELEPDHYYLEREQAMAT